MGPEESMQLYGRGIRRRPAPMLGDAKRLRLAYSLVLSLPGTPVLRYGDEIGMGESLRRPRRYSPRRRRAVRLPLVPVGAVTQRSPATSSASQPSTRVAVEVPILRPRCGAPPRCVALLHGRLRASLAATTGVETPGDVARYLLAGADA